MSLSTTKFYTIFDCFSANAQNELNQHKLCKILIFIAFGRTVNRECNAQIEREREEGKEIELDIDRGRDIDR